MVLSTRYLLISSDYLKKSRRIGYYDLLFDCKMNKFLSLFNIRRLVECRPVSTILTAHGKEVPKRKVFENRITLIGTDNSLSITDLKNAQSLSERRELKLVKLQDVDSKTRRPVYK